MATTEGPIEDRSLDTDEEQAAWAPSEIEDRLLLGSIADATNGNALAEHGVTVVISILDAQEHERLVLPRRIELLVAFVSGCLLRLLLEAVSCLRAWCARECLVLGGGITGMYHV